MIRLNSQLPYRSTQELFDKANRLPEDRRMSFEVEVKEVQTKLIKLKSEYESVDFYKFNYGKAFATWAGSLAVSFAAGALLNNSAELGLLVGTATCGGVIYATNGFLDETGHSTESFVKEHKDILKEIEQDFNNLAREMSIYDV